MNDEKSFYLHYDVPQVVVKGGAIDFVCVTTEGALYEVEERIVDMRHLLGQKLFQQTYQALEGLKKHPLYTEDHRHVLVMVSGKTGTPEQHHEGTLKIWRQCAAQEPHKTFTAIHIPLGIFQKLMPHFGIIIPP